jgi:hypothetical protein
VLISPCCLLLSYEVSLFVAANACKVLCVSFDGQAQGTPHAGRQVTRTGGLWEFELCELLSQAHRAESSWVLAGAWVALVPVPLYVATVDLNAKAQG